MIFRWNRSRYSDMRTNCWPPSVLVLILFLTKRKAGSATVYVVTGARSDFNGVYEEKREPELHYKKLSGANKRGNYRFLYKGSQLGNTWILGRGETLFTAWAGYRSPAVEGRPPADQWSFVLDRSRSREGEEVVDPWHIAQEGPLG